MPVGLVDPDGLCDTIGCTNDPEEPGADFCERCRKESGADGR